MVGGVSRWVSGCGGGLVVGRGGRGGGLHGSYVFNIAQTGRECMEGGPRGARSRPVAAPASTSARGIVLELMVACLLACLFADTMTHNTTLIH